MRARLVSAVAAVATATLVPVLGLVGAQAAYAGGGNSGHLEVSEVGGPADSSNDPHVGCSFDLQWYGYQRSDATVRFESQAPTAGAVITKTQGPDKVSLGSAASGSVMNAARTYTLKFTGADPQANQGYHVKVSTDAAGAKGASGNYKVFWVECDRADAPTPTTIRPSSSGAGRARCASGSSLLMCWMRPIKSNLTSQIRQIEGGRPMREWTSLYNHARFSCTFLCGKYSMPNS